MTKPPRTIRRAFTRFYSDNRQLNAYVEWSDGSRTEGAAHAPKRPAGAHMNALFDRAKRDGLTITHEVWS